MSPRVRTSQSVSDGGEARHIELAHPQLAAVTVHVRRNRRARHVRLHVDELGDVTASVPTRFAAERLDPIVRERADWLHEVLTRMQLTARDTEVDLAAGDPVPLLGERLPSRLERGGRRASVRIEQGVMCLRVPDEDDPHDVLLGWYRREARLVFEQRVRAWALRLGLQYGRVSIREQRTRWGSCTHRGDLSFNWRLLLAPAWVLDSIVVHELCHIDELNHSERFWALLDERYPRHREASDWLREHGPTLRVTRPSLPLAADLRPWPVESPLALRPPRRRRRGSSGARPATDQLSLFGD